MQLFFTTDIKGDYAYFPESEARHATQVLRKQIGDELQFVDGKGNWYKGLVSEAGKKKCILKITHTNTAHEPLPVHIHLAIAPTKNIDRLEWCLEKATEIGVSEITPLICHHSERRRIREDRLEKVLVAAMKQSLKAYLPKLNPLIKFEQFIKTQLKDSTPEIHKEAVTQNSQPKTQNFIAHCADDVEKSLLQHNYLRGNNVCILIGPEGDFSPDEIAIAIQHGFSPVSLGRSRLRTETAGVVAVHTVNFINECNYLG